LKRPALAALRERRDNGCVSLRIIWVARSRHDSAALA
jgi:hypothetical protein